ncbi:peptidylprolyl isomerase [Grimontia hollisae]|uniref:Peptidyl-prolyl cis-trans isomerase n=2 Tax=Grimontia hollisae TaxID=673 RepID=D0I758_GRIHO|nr:peptidylprolyl isomerase [Grimontia hollisae]AMG31357.1 peptidylprolyl isomerase [Grimontia hollisae]EEY72477.1 FKBP-type peptidyl-prolyl cis-trans isomerase SlyD [Grimontia hollisae CIP 101886]MDF2185714.1 peptidylprolyl isomerase [Grimontia hollisae]STO45871.1 FKBP-type peptidyl-prolyl cis-trans isomerase slyD [Grimontia hollisae]STO58061.1 FKBP-type peptidyl-prolyl cis-trans isomerase slyD [Grimontia hollisae]
MIEENKVVKIDYTVKDEDGQLIDTSEGQDPLAYLHGAGNIIPGLEQALAGRAEGEEFSVQIQPDDAYGQRNEALIQKVERGVFQGVEQLEVGMVFNAQGPQGNIQVTIVAIDGDEVTIDGNHPLAGVVLSFEGVIREVRDATAEEIEHGHVH